MFLIESVNYVLLFKHTFEIDAFQESLKPFYLKNDFDSIQFIKEQEKNIYYDRIAVNTLFMAVNIFNIFMVLSKNVQ